MSTSKSGLDIDSIVRDIFRKSLLGMSDSSGGAGSRFETGVCHLFVLLGASGDLAKKKTYPALWWLYRDGLLPDNTKIFGYARSDLTVEDLKTKCRPFMNVKDDEEEKVF